MCHADPVVPTYAIIVPILGGTSLLLGIFLAVIVDMKLIRRETKTKIAPRYLSAATVDPKRPPFWLFLVGTAIFSVCTTLTAYSQVQMANELGLSFDGSRLFNFSVVAAATAFLFAFKPIMFAFKPMKSAPELVRIFVILHYLLIILLATCGGTYVLESAHLTSLLVNSGHCSSAIGNVREWLLTKEVMMGIPHLYWGVVAFPAVFGIYAHKRLEVTWGWREGASQIDHEKVFLWSLLPFSTCVAQVIAFTPIALTLILSALEFASI